MGLEGRGGNVDWKFEGLVVPPCILAFFVSCLEGVLGDSYDIRDQNFKMFSYKTEEVQSIPRI